MSATTVNEVGLLSRSASPASTFSIEDHLNGHLMDLLPKHCRTSPVRKAKRIRFYRNGDRFYKGVVMAVTQERYRSFDSLVTDLTRALVDNVNLPSGVRNLFTMDGHKVCCLEDLEDGKCYVCSGLGESFKRIDYGANQTNAKLKHRRSVSAMSPVTPRAITSRFRRVDSVRPRLITIVRNGTRPRKVIRLLLNKRNAPSFDHALSSITEAVKLDSGAVRKVFNQAGIQINRLDDFFGLHYIFFAYGTERYYKEDFDLDVEECKAIEAQNKGPSGFRRYPWHSSRSSQGLSSSQEHNGGSGMPRMPGKVVGSQPANQDTASVPPQVSLTYDIGPIIGDGNFAVVRRCINRVSGLEYALKIIDKCKCRGKEHMIESEVTILRKVRHPNIIRLIHEHDATTELYLVMELVRGGDLFDAISEASKFSEVEAAIMIRNLASALFYLHSLSIVHRDVKPENLLVCIDESGTRTLKLADFGLAQKVTESLYTVCGTPTYVAPEILAESGYGLKIDVWAAGVILYILLCGFPPFVGRDNDQDALFDQILSGSYEFTAPYWDSVSQPAKDLIAHMLQVQPEYRLSAEDVLDHHWLAASGGAESLKVFCTSSLHYSKETTLSSPDLPALCSLTG